MRSKDDILAAKQERYLQMQQEEDVNKTEGEWEFDAKVAPVFEEHVRASVPLYDHFHSLIEDLSVHFVEPETMVYDLGTSTGESIRRVQAKNKDREDVIFVGYDNSQAMIDQCMANDNQDVRFQYADLTDERTYLENASFVTSILTLQFISVTKRADIVQRVYDNLNKGGAFILVEKVIASDTLIDSIFTTEYEKYKRTQGLSSEHIYIKKQSLKGVMKPISAEDNKEMLRNAGFKKMETFFRSNNFIGIIAIK